MIYKGDDQPLAQEIVRPGQRYMPGMADSQGQRVHMTERCDGIEIACYKRKGNMVIPYLPYQLPGTAVQLRIPGPYPVKRCCTVTVFQHSGHKCRVCFFDQSQGAANPDAQAGYCREGADGPEQQPANKGACSQRIYFPLLYPVGRDIHQGQYLIRFMTDKYACCFGADAIGYQVYLCCLVFLHQRMDKADDVLFRDSSIPPLGIAVERQVGHDQGVPVQAAFQEIIGAAILSHTVHRQDEAGSAPDRFIGNDVLPERYGSLHVTGMVLYKTTEK